MYVVCVRVGDEPAFMGCGPLPALLGRNVVAALTPSTCVFRVRNPAVGAVG